MGMADGIEAAEVRASVNRVPFIRREDFELGKPYLFVLEVHDIRESKDFKPPKHERFSVDFKVLQSTHPDYPVGAMLCYSESSALEFSYLGNVKACLMALLNYSAGQVTSDLYTAVVSSEKHITPLRGRKVGAEFIGKMSRNRKPFLDVQWTSAEPPFKK